MKTEVIIGDPASTAVGIEALRAKVATWSVDALREELANQLALSVENITMLAVIISELEARGDDLSAFKMGLLPILRKVACGEIVPEIVVQYADRPAVMKSIARLHPEEQKLIASGQKKYNPPAPKPRIVRPYRAPEKEEDDDVTPRVVESVVKHAKSVLQESTTVIGVASQGSPRDVAELAFNVIHGNKERGLALKCLFNMLVTSGLVEGELAKQMSKYTPDPPSKRDYY